MAFLDLPAVRDIALEAVQSVVVRAPDDIEVADGVDWTGDPIYPITIQSKRDLNGPVTALQRVRVQQRIRDALTRSGDETYPFLRVLPREDWDARVRARTA